MDYIKSRVYNDQQTANKQAEQASWLHGFSWVVPTDGKFLVLASESINDAPASFSMAFNDKT